MFNIVVHRRIHQIISLFYYIRLWRADTVSDLSILISKIVHLIVYIYYPVSLMAGAFTNDNETEKMFLIVLSIVTFVLAVRLYYILWQKDEIIGFVRKFGAHSIADSDGFHRVNNKITMFIKLVTFMEMMLLGAVVAMTIITSPLISTVKQLPMNIYFPLDWRHNELFYWIAFVFVIYEMMISMSSSLLNAIIWYLMMSCAIKYQVLGNELRNLGCSVGEKGSNENMLSDDEIGNLFYTKLIRLIKNHHDLQETTEEFKSCFANLFFIQIATSALTICGSVYALAFSSVENPFQLGVYAVVTLYSFFDIFMVTHFGNEIKFSSGLLSYSVFQSNWLDQSEACKKCIFIMMEVLKKPQELVVGKVYPLDLEIFTQILKLAYSMFNILQNVK